MHAPQRRWWNVIYMDLEFNDPDSHYPAVVLLTSQWRVFYHVNHTFHQLVKSNSLNEPTVMCVFSFSFFCVGLAKWNAAWYAARVASLQTLQGKKYVFILSRCFMRKRDLVLASCAYWADNQSYRTTGSVQQEQESSPFITEPEHTEEIRWPPSAYCRHVYCWNDVSFFG